MNTSFQITKNLRSGGGVGYAGLSNHMSMLSEIERESQTLRNESMLTYAGSIADA